MKFKKDEDDNGCRTLTLTLDDARRQRLNVSVPKRRYRDVFHSTLSVDAGGHYACAGCETETLRKFAKAILKEIDQ